MAFTQFQYFIVQFKDGRTENVSAPAGSSCKQALDYNGLLAQDVQKISSGPVLR